MRQTKGQASVELALGSLVIVTILLFGIHFGEMGYLGAKVHEAEASALWDSTAYRTHRLMQWYDSSAAIAGGNAVNARYSDFDGRSSANGGPPRLAMTQAGPIQVTCVGQGGYPLPAPSPFGDPSGISCSAEATLNVIRGASRDFAETGTGGFFKATHRVRSVYTVCGTGRYYGNGCGNMEMLLGDLALHDGNEQNMCSLTAGGSRVCNDNPNFYRAAQSVFNQTRPFTGIPENWADRIIPDVPGNQLTGFYMSFRGEDSPYGPFRERVDNGDVWETTPFRVPLPNGSPYADTYNASNACKQGAGGYCYLGKINCN